MRTYWLGPGGSSWIELELSFQRNDEEFASQMQEALLQSKLEAENRKQNQAHTDEKVVNPKKSKNPTFSLEQFNSLRPAEIENLGKENDESLEVQTDHQKQSTKNGKSLTQMDKETIAELNELLRQEKLKEAVSDNLIDPRGRPQSWPAVITIHNGCPSVLPSHNFKPKRESLWADQ